MADGANINVRTCIPYVSYRSYKRAPIGSAEYQQILRRHAPRTTQPRAGNQPQTNKHHLARQYSANFRFTYLRTLLVNEQSTHKSTNKVYNYN